MRIDDLRNHARGEVFALLACGAGSDRSARGVATIQPPGPGADGRPGLPVPARPGGDTRPPVVPEEIKPYFAEMGKWRELAHKAATLIRTPTCPGRRNWSPTTTRWTTCTGNMFTRAMRAG